MSHSMVLKMHTQLGWATMGWGWEGRRRSRAPAFLMRLWIPVLPFDNILANIVANFAAFFNTWEITEILFTAFGRHSSTTIEKSQIAALDWQRCPQLLAVLLRLLLLLLRRLMPIRHEGDWYYLLFRIIYTFDDICAEQTGIRGPKSFLLISKLNFLAYIFWNCARI